jgi:hypothetical protein
MSGISAGELCHRVIIQRNVGNGRNEYNHEQPADWQVFFYGLRYLHYQQRI